MPERDSIARKGTATTAGEMDHFFIVSGRALSYREVS